jgi:hypothetical protein
VCNLFYSDLLEIKYIEVLIFLLPNWGNNKTKNIAMVLKIKRTRPAWACFRCCETKAP